MTVTERQEGRSLDRKSFFMELTLKLKPELWEARPAFTQAKLFAGGEKGQRTGLRLHGWYITATESPK